MPIFTIVEVAIGLTFMYLLISLVVTWINEWIAYALNLRGESLKLAIQNLFFKDPAEFLKDPEAYLEEHPDYEPFIEKFYGHAVIKALGKEKVDETTGNTEVARKPSYIPPSTVASIVIDVLFDEDYADKKGEDLKALIEMIPHSDTRDAFLAFYRAGAQSMDDLRDRIESWFNVTMDRLGGWYKRKAHMLSFVVGLVLALALNVDTFVVAQALWREPTLRTSVAQHVEAYSAQFQPPGEVSSPGDIPIDDIQEALTTLEWPIGWTTYAPKTKEMKSAAQEAGRDETLAVAVGWFLKGAGWLATGLAVSQGAPFWFDLLNKITNIRASGSAPEEGEGG